MSGVYEWCVRVGGVYSSLRLIEQPLSTHLPVVHTVSLIEPKSRWLDALKPPHSCIGLSPLLLLVVHRPRSIFGSELEATARSGDHLMLAAVTQLLCLARSRMNWIERTLNIGFRTHHAPPPQCSEADPNEIRSRSCTSTNVISS